MSADLAHDHDDDCRYPAQLALPAEAWVQSALERTLRSQPTLRKMKDWVIRYVDASRALLLTVVDGAVREVVVLRYPMVVTVFDLVEHGRRFYRLVIVACFRFWAFSCVE